VSLLRQHGARLAHELIHWIEGDHCLPVCITIKPRARYSAPFKGMQIPRGVDSACAK
jgi:hypothetical protein